MRYKEYRDLFNKIKKLAKQNYFQTLLNKYKDDIKSTWDTPALVEQSERQI